MLKIKCKYILILIDLLEIKIRLHSFLSKLKSIAFYSFDKRTLRRSRNYIAIYLLRTFSLCIFEIII